MNHWRGVARRARLGWLLVALLAAALQDFSPPDQQPRIDPERPGDETEDDDRSDAEPATRETEAAASAQSAITAAIVLDVFAPSEIIPAHVILPL